jgi:hypothetical protein
MSDELRVLRAVPVVCSLDGPSLAARAAGLSALMASALAEADRTPNGDLRLRFRRLAGVEAALEDLARRERECCPTVRWRVRPAGEDVLVTIAGPPEAAPLLDAMADLGRS